VRAGLLATDFDDDEGVELHHQGDLPARSGIGSSSAFAVGLINVLHAMRGQSIDKDKLAHAAIDLEQNKLKETVGCQDQVASAYGGLNVIRFNKDGSIEVEPLDLNDGQRQAFEQSLMVFSKQLVDNLGTKTKNLQRMQAMVPEAVEMLRRADMDSFGHLLHETWTLKRGLTGAISTSAIDRIYDDAIRAGALGGKLLGAGGAGFMVFVVPKDKQPHVREALSHLISVPVRVDFTGSTIIYRQE
jgi:D-glycero-alpha-D-manno-heptose-7-phosphate kinase